LVAAAVLQEPLAGDRQYWLTRPFSARQLLAAKALFVAVFVNLAVLLVQFLFLLRLGIPPLAHLDALFWRQVFLCAQILLPAAALYAASRSFTQILLVALLTVVGFRLLASQFLLAVWTAPVWFGPATGQAVLALGAGSVIYLQYTRRNTLLSWIMLGAMTVLFFLVMHNFWEDPTPRTVRITLDTAARRPRAPHPGPVEIPLLIEGIPAGVEASVGRVGLTFAGQYVGYTTLASVTGIAGGKARLLVPPLPYSAETPLHLSGSIEFVLIQRLQSAPVPAQGEYVGVPGVGVCTQRQSEWAHSTLVCLAPSSRTALALEFPGRGLRWVISPGVVERPGSFARAFQPVDRVESVPTGLEGDPPRMATAQALVTARTLARLHGVFDFPAIRLADYPVPE
jgi:hypothetical protein